ncbi:MAG: hypothetical protein WDM90_22965 [Ferruginibacter sp.]
MIKNIRAEPLIMAEVPISSEISNPNQKFIYEYDFNKFWHFMIELINVDKGEKNNLVYPYCIRTEGIAPSQYGTKAWLTAALPRWKKNTTCGPRLYLMDLANRTKMATAWKPRVRVRARARARVRNLQQMKGMTGFK